MICSSKAVLVVACFVVGPDFEALHGLDVQMEIDLW